MANRKSQKYADSLPIASPTKRQHKQELTALISSGSEAGPVSLLLNRSKQSQKSHDHKSSTPQTNPLNVHKSTSGSTQSSEMKRGQVSVKLRSQQNTSASYVPATNPDSAQQTNPSNRAATTRKNQKPRRRVATVAQRRAANIRERRRMFNLNSAFDQLRKKVPSFAYEKRLSRIETLKLAIMYIKFMNNLVTDDSYAEKYKQLMANVQVKSPQTRANFEPIKGFFDHPAPFQASSASPKSASVFQMQQPSRAILNPQNQIGQQRYSSDSPSASMSNGLPSSSPIQTIAQLYSFPNTMIDQSRTDLGSDQLSLGKTSTLYARSRDANMSIATNSAMLCNEPQCRSTPYRAQQHCSSPQAPASSTFCQPSSSPSLSSSAASSTITCISPNVNRNESPQTHVQPEIQARTQANYYGGQLSYMSSHEHQASKLSASSNEYYAAQSQSMSQPNEFERSCQNEHFEQSFASVSSESVQAYPQYHDPHQAQTHQHQEPSHRRASIGRMYTLHSLEAR